MIARASRAADVADDYVALVDVILNAPCRPCCRVPHTRHWRERWVRNTLPATLATMPALARELIDR